MKTRYSVISNTLFFLLLLFVAISCSKDEEGLSDNYQEPNVSQNSYFDLDNRSDEEGDSLDCFTFVYPLEVVFPDNSTTLVNNDEELEQLIDDWIMSNPDSDEYPSFVFPIDVLFPDGEVMSVNNEEELCELFFECEGYEDDWEDDGEDEDEDEGEDEGEEDDSLDCFTFVYPLEVVFPDNSTTLVNNDEELEQLIDDWIMSNPDSDEYPSFVFPIEVLFPGGEVMSINNEDELDELIFDCEEYEDDWEDDGEDDSEEDDCDEDDEDDDSEDDEDDE